MMLHSGGESARLLANLILAGEIPGIGRDDLMTALAIHELTGTPAALRMPVIYCGRCGAQLVAHWYACTPATDLELLCLFCATTAEDNGAEIHALIVPRGVHRG